MACQYWYVYADTRDGTNDLIYKFPCVVCDENDALAAARDLENSGEYKNAEVKFVEENQILSGFEQFSSNYVPKT